MRYPVTLAKVATQIFASDPTGSTFSFEIPADNFLEAVVIKVRANVATLTGAANGDGFANVLARIQFIPGTAERNSLVDVSGPGILDYLIQTASSLDRSTSSAYTTANLTAASSHLCTYYVPFVPPNLDDPAGSAFLVPLWRFPNNPTLQITFNAALNMAATTFTLTAGVIVEVYTVKRIAPQALKTIPLEITETSFVYSSTGNGISQNMPSPGTYLSAMFRGYSNVTTATRADLTANGTAWNSTYNMSQIALGQSIPYQFDFPGVWNTNQQTFGQYIGGPFATGTAVAPMLDFVSDRPGSTGNEVGSAFVVDPSLAPRPIFTTTIAAAGTIKLLAVRAFPDEAK